MRINKKTRPNEKAVDYVGAKLDKVIYQLENRIKMQEKIYVMKTLKGMIDF
jgi:hypothetical protein